jgi:hypothetical protein
MLKKDNKVKWIMEAKVFFLRVKKSIGEAPMLLSLDYSKEFLIFSFASEHAIIVVLLHKNNEGFEQLFFF